MKKVASSLLLACLTTAFLLPASIAPTSAYAADTINVEIQGVPLQSEQAPFVHNSRTFVPLRSIFEALGATINYDAATRTVTSTKGDVTVQLTLGSNVAYRNGAPVELDAAPMVRDDRSYVPVRFIAESFNTPVKWDGATKTVRLLESNRAKLEKLLSETPAVPFSYHVDYVGNYTLRTDGKGYLGTRTADIDLSYDLGTESYNYHAKYKQIGDVFRGVNDFDLYVTGERAYVLFNGFQNWQTSSLDKAPNIESKFINKAFVPMMDTSAKFAKYAVLEETDTENIITFYVTPQVNKEMLAEKGLTSTLSDSLKKSTTKYHLNKHTNYWNKLESWQTTQLDANSEVITYEIFTYSKVGQPYTLTLPEGAYNATEADLTKLY